MTTDVVLNRDNGYYDISFDPDTGDLAIAQSLDTAILMSIMEEVRAEASEIADPLQRRGWVGNETNDDGFEQGTKAWQFYQERITGTVLAELGPVIRNGLQWLIDDGIAVNVKVETPQYKSGRITVAITLYRDGSQVDRKLYEIWNNTGAFNGYGPA